MATSNTSTGGFATVGPMPEKFGAIGQEFADALAARLKIPTPVGEAGPPGQGSLVEITHEVLAIAAGARVVTAPFDVSRSILNLVNSADSEPTLAISCVDGTSVKLTAAAPNDNYSLHITRIILIE